MSFTNILIIEFIIGMLIGFLFTALSVISLSAAIATKKDVRFVIYGFPFGMILAIIINYFIKL